MSGNSPNLVTLVLLFITSATTRPEVGCRNYFFPQQVKENLQRHSLSGRLPDLSW
jgi:hypothetical protein